ncbi:hypothetical protein NUW58_g9269 [Xylaria curta]|uniref:Uncharacterized protein n=1 Tax=Xylaria curta TaxID=42375 RepID=A0ACC1MZ67_9PEZI|nr:hypothetical protein NUW58_g9269 [Xylaria curta]
MLYIDMYRSIYLTSTPNPKADSTVRLFHFLQLHSGESASPSETLLFGRDLVSITPVRDSKQLDRVFPNEQARGNHNGNEDEDGNTQLMVAEGEKTLRVSHDNDELRLNSFVSRKIGEIIFDEDRRREKKWRTLHHLFLGKASAERSTSVLIALKLGNRRLGGLLAIKADNTGSSGTSTRLILNLGLVNFANGSEQLDKILIAGRPRKLEQMVSVELIQRIMAKRREDSRCGHI